MKFFMFSVKVIEYDIPGGILPSHLSGKLYDAKVGILKLPKFF